VIEATLHNRAAEQANIRNPLSAAGRTSKSPSGYVRQPDGLLKTGHSAQRLCCYAVTLSGKAG
jgi:hypothetical protein